MLWDMHLCVFDVRLSFENRVHTCELLILINKAHNWAISVANVTSVSSTMALSRVGGNARGSVNFSNP